MQSLQLFPCLYCAAQFLHRNNLLHILSHIKYTRHSVIFFKSMIYMELFNISTVWLAHFVKLGLDPSLTLNSDLTPTHPTQTFLHEGIVL